MKLNSLPLLPLGNVLFPQGVLPLRIFEVRYLDMIGKCIQTGAPFGVVVLTEGSEVRKPQGHEAFVDIGTLANITSNTSPQPGLKLVQCVGAQRFRVLRSECLKHGLWIADVELMDQDIAVAIPEDLQSSATALRNVLAALPAQTIAPTHAPANDQWNDCAWVSNRWCELLPMPLPLKQKMLELDNPMVRLELVNDLLEKFKLL